MNSLKVPVGQRYRLGEKLPPLDAFRQAERDGWVWSKTLRTPDNRTYVLFNYSKITPYERHWDAVTRIARGLVVCLDTLETIALPMSKFFNLGEQYGPNSFAQMRRGPFSARVKMDGSLGIGFRLADELSWATRGSFESAQSAIARALWKAKYARFNELFFTRWNHLTPMVEIIHPETRVVVRYDYEDLVLIAARDRETGADLPYDQLQEMADTIGMRIAEQLPSTSLEELLRKAEQLDSNHEGFVFWFPPTAPDEESERVKVKGEQYKRAHRILTGLTPAYIAECWCDCKQDELLREMPEEYRPENEERFAKLDAEVCTRVDEVEAMYRQAPDTSDRRAFSKWVQDSPERKERKGPLFTRLQLSHPEAAQTMAAMALSRAVQNGKIAELCPGRQPLLEALARYESAVGTMLRADTSSPEGLVRLGRVIQNLPKELRGGFSAALHGLRPELLVEKMRTYVQQPEFRQQYGTVDVDGIFAKAPEPTAPNFQHNEWVFSQPLVLRSFLDRYRHCRLESTAVYYARLALGIGITSAKVATLLSGTGLEECLGLEARLGELKNEVAQVWHVLPDNVSATVRWDAARASGSPWATLLLACSWQSHRELVRDQFIEANKNVVDLDDEG